MGQALFAWVFRIAVIGCFAAAIAYVAVQPLDEAARRVHELLTIIPR